MASQAEVKREREAPTVPVELTERELLRAMKAATADQVRCEQASDLALSSLGEAALYTLAEKLQAAYKAAHFEEPHTLLFALRGLLASGSSDGILPRDHLHAEVRGGEQREGERLPRHRRNDPADVARPERPPSGPVAPRPTRAPLLGACGMSKQVEVPERRCTCEGCPHPWRDPNCAIHGDPLAQFIEAFFDRWEDYPPDEVRAHWERDLTEAWNRTLPAIYKHFSDRLLSDEAVDALAKRLHETRRRSAPQWEELSPALQTPSLANARLHLEAALQAASIPATPQNEEGR